MRPLLIALSFFIAASSPACAQGDAARGKFVFLQCQACHATQPDAPANIGPALAGVYGKPAAAQPGYEYSAALKKSGIIWNAANLDTWLTSPNAMVPGTKMAFEGIAQPDLRADVIAYLATLK